MRSRPSLTLGLALAVALCLAAVPSAAQKPPSSRPAPVHTGPIALRAIPAGTLAGPEQLPSRLKAELRPAYEALKADERYRALENDLAGRHDRPDVVDRYLAYMPISPLEYLQIDMEARRYEIAVPRFIHEWHVRWIRLHESVARARYGDAYVDSKLAGWPVDTSAGAQEGLDLRTIVGTNRNAASTASPAPEDYQGEIQVAVNPNNPSQIVAAANTWDPIGGTCAGGIQAVFYSSDGGATWGYTCPPGAAAYSLGSCAGTVFGSDPAVYWNDSNEVFLNHMMLCAVGPNTRFAMVVARSTTGGATWNAQGVIVNSWGDTDLEDKNFYVVDNYPTSPFYGRHYTCWDRNNNEKSAFSTTNGATWTEVDLPTPPGGGFDLGCDLAVQDNGTVHVVFNTLTCAASCSNERMFYTRSTTGGASWSAPVLVRDFNLVGFSGANCPDAQDERCVGPFGSVDVDNSGGACDGTLYATFTDFTSGGVNNSDVFISRSTNNGATWSAPIAINDDGLTNRIQFHPFLVVDQSNGQAVVGWHDARNDAGNDAVDYFVARSLDCGVTFQPNVQVSQASAEFNNSAISFSNENTADNPNRNPNQYGEYLGLDAGDCKAYLAWADTRHFHPGSATESQAENLGFATVDFECGGGAVCGNGIIEAGEVCDGANLGGQTCVGLGFAGGTLACNGSCTAFDTSGCTVAPCTTTTLYTHNFETGSGLAGWTRGTFNGSSVADWRGIQTCAAASGTRIFRYGGNNCTANYANNRFIFAQPNGAGGVAVPAGSTTARLVFKHRRQFETGFDGGLLALSLDGTNYTVVPASAIASGASYNGTVAATCAPTGAAGLPIFTGTQASFVTTEIDLDAACNLVTGGSSGCGGQALRIGFTAVADCSVNADGWFLDDVTVTACVP